MKRLQAALQWLFLRVEDIFNRAFGDRLNPLYHLGAITFFLVWVVAGSGLYLYAFFETGVADAHASVEALTHHQWFAGGILRSLHRYASDTFVIVLFLHLRHGIQSLAQTLGLNHGRYTPLIQNVSFLLAAAIAGGNAFLALSVLTGIVKVAP